MQEKLKKSSLSTKNYNSLREVFRPDERTLAFLNIKEKNGLVQQISLCFAETVLLSPARKFGEVDIPEKVETDYLWVDIFPSEKKLICRLLLRQNNQFDDISQIKAQYQPLIDFVIDIFDIQLIPASDAKNTLFKMFKDLTHTAELPFKKLIEPLAATIDKFANDVAKQLKLPSSTTPVNIPYRTARLLERALIQRDIKTAKSYYAYIDGKKGVVQRFSFSDPTGASVHAVSSGVKEGLAVAEIYFDTRDTIEELKYMNKLWGYMV